MLKRWMWVVVVSIVRPCAREAVLGVMKPCKCVMVDEVCNINVDELVCVYLISLMSISKHMTHSEIIVIE